MTTINTISILGCGWYGLALAKALVHNGLNVKGSTTSADKLGVLAEAGIKPYLVSFAPDNESYDGDFFNCDVLWICIPPRGRQGEAGGYLGKLKRIALAATQHKVKHVVFISSTGVYGDVNAEVNELDAPQPDTDSGKALLSVETFLQQQTAFTATIIRFGGLVGPGREPGRFFAGKKGIPNGLAPVNLIHLDDCVGLSIALLQQQAFGRVYNACTPHHPTKAHFYKQAALKAGLEAPEFIPQLLQWKTVASLYTKTELKYEYHISNWDEWLYV